MTANKASPVTGDDPAAKSADAGQGERAGRKFMPRAGAKRGLPDAKEFVDRLLVEDKIIMDHLAK